MEKELRLFTDKKRAIIEKLMKHPELLEEVEGLAKNEERENGIPKEVRDLVGGLGYLADPSYPLDRLQMLVQIIDEIVAEDGGLPWNENRVIDICYWQKKIIDEIRQDLDAHDNIIAKLKSLVNKGEKLETFKTEHFKPDSRKLEALRHLASLFVMDNLFYTDTTDMGNLKVWCIAHEYDLEMVKGLLGNGEDREAEEKGGV